MKTSSLSYQKQHGFTLIEIMITVAIIALLSAVAWPNWQNYVTRTHRTSAKACAMEQAQFMERFYTQNMSYSVSRSGADVALPNTECAASSSDFYTFSLSNLTPSTYTISATPAGSQATKDTDCGTMTIDQTGNKTATGSKGADKCW